LLKEIYKIPEAEFLKRVESYTKLLEVEELLNRQVRKLSLGERMKMELIAAIIHNPEILFLDEPTIGLDIIAKKNIRKFLKDIQKNSNITLILTSHDMDDIEQVCERVIVINKGTKVYDDSLETLNSHYKQTRFVKFIFGNNNPKAELETPSEILESSEEGILFKVENALMSKLIAEVSTKFDVIDIEIIAVPLEEMIEDIFKKQI